MENNYIERYWRDARPEDAIKEPPMVARFRDEPDQKWVVSCLYGIDTRRGYWFSEGNAQGCTIWWHCQVYDAPEPGEGWRLIDVDKEQPQEGDEVFSKIVNWWIVRARIAPFEKNFIYRRRIEQPKPEPKYVPFTWEDREQLRGRWVVGSDGNEWCIVRLDQHQGNFFINSRSAEGALEEWCFADTREPVGRRVE